MHAIAAKALITILAAIAVAAGLALFTIAKQDGSKIGQVLGVAIFVLAAISAIYFTLWKYELLSLSAHSASGRISAWSAPRWPSGCNSTTPISICWRRAGLAP